MIFKKKRFFKQLALFLTVNILYQTFSVSIAWALTSGPSQPEFSSFEPVTTTSMVNDFTGSFTYNLPVLEVPSTDGPGYAMSLSYHAGSSPEDEASWVGYGWTLNPGAINRNKRGFPDDVKGGTVTYWNKMPKNWTASVGGHVGIEVLGLHAASGNTVSYNNYKGFGYSSSYSLSRKGLGSIGFDVNDGKGSFSARINPGALLSKFVKSFIKENKESGNQTKEATKFGQWKKDASAAVSKGFNEKSTSLLGSSNYGILTYGSEMRPTRMSEYSGTCVNFSVQIQVDPTAVPAGLEWGLDGSYSEQKNTTNEDLSAYGYLYSKDADSDENYLMDYYSEKDVPYEKKNQILAIPFSNADNYMVTGEGIAGGFRAYNKSAGHFRPNHKNSKTTIGELSVAIHSGDDAGVGATIGVGQEDLSVGKWNDLTTFASASALDHVDEANIFRFSNDLGGDIYYGDGSLSESDLAKAQKADMSGGGVYGARSFDPVLGSNIANTTMNNSKRSGRSSYIAYHTNGEMNDAENPVTKINYRAYHQAGIDNRNDPAERYINRAEDQIKYNIGEYAVVNEEGSKYIYGLPSYARNEVNMQYGLQGVDISATSGNLQNNYLIKTPLAANSDGYNIKVGEEHNYPYVSSYLLTEINSKDYVDRTMNGPSPDDFGSYTLFHYKQLYGSNSTNGNSKHSGGSWYKWRTPYNGLKYNKNSMSDAGDDIASVSRGEKEIYNLESVETKTHIAIFVTNTTDITFAGKNIKGSKTVRPDGLDAARGGNEDDGNAAGSFNLKGTKTLERLERIELYAKPTDGSNDYTLIKTVNLGYDYTTQSSGNLVPNSTSGKLTLTKVWFEYQGVQNATISPYTFEYKYPDPSLFLNSKVANRYPNIVSYGSGKSENPAYSYFASDAWGNYQENGETRYDALTPWLSQMAPSTTFDPAAWQLKQIHLPSGGNIIVQYEQNDYTYVQDRRAMGMVSIKGRDDSTNKLYINTEDLDVNAADPAEQQALINLIRNEFINKGQKIYFKLLYQLQTLAGNSDCNKDYITGYVDVDKVGYEQIPGSSDYAIYIQLKAGDALPDNVCNDFVKAERSGKDLSNCNVSNGLSQGGGIKSMVYALIDRFGADFNAGICAHGDDSQSFLRVPLSKAKKGGGIRVKRILTYDSGIEASDDNLYGTEYIYTTTDPNTGNDISSGVAINEPAAIREENALVGFIPKLKQDFLDKAFAGRDKEQSEGPIGESILPGASIGYSRIISKNIYDKQTNPGFTVNEYFTAKDYPYDKDYSTYLHTTGANFTSISQEKDWMLIPAYLINYSLSNLWLTQGFSFVQNSMHGQIKKSATYAGNPADQSTWILSASQEYTYFEPGEPVQMVYKPGDVRSESPGREMETVFESRSVEDVTNDVNVELDLTVGIFPPIPFVTAIPTYSYNEAKLRTHVTTKILKYPAIQKSVKTYQDGAYSYRENMAFDKRTGAPVVVQNRDDFATIKDELGNIKSDPTHYVLNQQLTGPMYYETMGSPAQNQGYTLLVDQSTLKTTSDLDALKNNARYIEFTGGASPCGEAGGFALGDLIKINTGNDLYRIIDFDYVKDRIYIDASGFNPNPNNFPTTSISSLEVVRSGYTNQLSAQVGNISFHNTVDYYGSQKFTNLDDQDPFAKALNDDLDIQLTNGNVPYNNAALAVNGSFSGVNVATDKCEIDGTCKANSSVTISNVKMGVLVDNVNEKLTLNFHSFNASDGTKSAFVDCDTRPGPTFISPPPGTNNPSVTNNTFPGLVGCTFPAPADVNRDDKYYHLRLGMKVYNPYTQSNSGWYGVTTNQSVTAGAVVSFKNGNEFYSHGSSQCISGVGWLGVGCAQYFYNQKSYYYLYKVGVVAPLLATEDQITYPFNDPGLYYLTTKTIVHTHCDCGDRTLYQSIYICVPAGEGGSTYTGSPKLTLPASVCPEVDPVTNCLTGYYNIYPIYSDVSSKLNNYYTWTGNLAFGSPVYGHDRDVIRINKSSLTGGVGGSYFINLKAENIYSGVVYNRFWSVLFYADCRPAAADISIVSNSCKKVEFKATPKCMNLKDYMWSFGDNTTSTDVSPVHDYACGGNYQVTLTATNTASSISGAFTQSLHVNACHPICECATTFLINGYKQFTSASGAKFTKAIGKFYLDKYTGKYVFIQAGCSRQTEFSCITVCSKDAPIVHNVLKATASEYNYNWGYNASNYPVPATNAYSNTNENFENGQYGKWRPANSFVYKTPVLQRTASASTVNNSQAGTFDWTPFSFNGTNAGNIWVKTQTVNNYTPNGSSNNESDVLNIPSIAEFGVKTNLPAFIANNANQDQAKFESFEESTNTARTSLYAHSGSYSLYAQTNQKTTVINQFIVVKGEEIDIRFWVKAQDKVHNDSKIVLYFTSFFNLYNFNKPAKILARSGDWVLYETKIASTDINPAITSESLSVSVKAVSNIWVDDFRIQPNTASMSCYVYDNKSLKLLASFDDQHFGHFYQYNAEGKLVRKLVETERGVKTIQETQYNTPKIPR